MAEQGQQQLPLKTGDRVELNIAEGLVGPGVIESMPKYPVIQKDEILEKQKLAALPDASVPAAPRPKEMEEVEDIEPEEIKKPAEAKVCAKCGWHLATPFDIKFTDDDKINFMRSCLTGGRFEKSYSLFRGLLRVTFRSRIVEESEGVSKHLQWEQTHANIDIRLMYVIAQKMDLALSLSRYQVFDDSGTCVTDNIYPVPTDELYPIDEEVGDKYSQFMCDRVHRKLFVDHRVSESLYNALYRKFVEFDALFQLFTVRVDDADFWPAIPSIT